jgi:hypothetical protein
MTTQFSDMFLEKFVAPDIRGFTAADIPDMSEHDPESRHWLANYVLNAGLRANYKPPGNAYVFNYLRRTVAAFREHEDAREATLGFLQTRQSVSLYAAAILHWEYFASQSWHALLLLRGFAMFLTGEEVSKPFARGDGSPEERLNNLYSEMKHVESRIENGQILPGATIPVWLSNDGIRSTDHTLSYEDTAAILRDLADWAEVVVDPREMGPALMQLSMAGIGRPLQARFEAAERPQKSSG